MNTWDGYDQACGDIEIVLRASEPTVPCSVWYDSMTEQAYNTILLISGHRDAADMRFISRSSLSASMIS